MLPVRLVDTVEALVSCMEGPRELLLGSIKLMGSAWV